MAATQDDPAPDPQSSAKRKALGCWFLAILGLVILAGLADPFSAPLQDKGRQMQAANNGRQILISLRGYAADHNGRFPEGATSNDAFRELFKGGLIDDERAFTASYSPFQPDNQIGEAPDYKAALERGENHWAMTRGLTEKSDPSTPLVFENPSMASWPPVWNIEAPNRPLPGRVWKNNKIIIGHVDGSINAEPLGPSSGPHATLAPNAEGKNLFELAGPHEVMDVAR